MTYSERSPVHGGRRQMSIRAESGLPPAVVVPDGIDAGLAWHYGHPMEEQRELAQGAAVIERSNRGVLTVTGPDRLPWLHSIITQHVSNLADGQSTEALVLSPHGHVEQHWQLSELGETVWLDVEPGTAAEAMKYMSMMRFLKRVELTDVSEHWTILTVAGPSAEAVLQAGGLPTPKPGHAVELAAGGFVRGMPASQQDTTYVFDLIVARESVADDLARLVAAGAHPAGTWAFEALRVQARQPRLRFETDHRTLAHEVSWIGSAVHLNKGCYRGQETVARVQNLGCPPRRLVLVYLGGIGEKLPAPGSPVENLGRTVGFVGTVVHHYELGPIALAVIKRSLPDNSDLHAGNQLVRIERRLEED
jgi:folate-binding protein YgfZ